MNSTDFVIVADNFEEKCGHLLKAEQYIESLICASRTNASDESDTALIRPQVLPQKMISAHLVFSFTFTALESD